MGIPLTLSQVPLETPYIQYVSSNGQTVFPYPFAITQDSDLIAVVNGATLNTDSGYSLSGQGNPTGGNLTFTSGQTAGAIVTLFRDIPIERVSQISQNSGFSSTVFNAEFNNIYLILQQLESSIGQCLQIPNTNNPAPSTTLTPTNYANKYLAFDSFGNPTPAVLTSSGAITQAMIAALLNVKTPTEVVLGITPTNFLYPADPYIDPRRYGALGDWNGSTGTDDTVAWQTAINVAYNSNGQIRFPPKFASLVGPLTLTMAAAKSLIISGPSPTGSFLHGKAGLSATSLLTLTSGNAATTQVSAYVKLENFGIDGAAVTSGVHGLSLLGIAAFQVSNVRITKFDRGIDCQGSLIGIIDQGTECSVNNTGIRIVAGSATTTANLIRIENARVNSSALIGIDFNGGTELQLRGVDIEGNGATNSTTTGALFIRGQLAPDSLEASVLVDGCWFEANGGISINIEAQTGGAQTIIAIRGGEILSADSGRAIICNGASKLSIEDLQCQSALDTWNLKATDCFLKNVIVSTLTDTNVTFPTYINVTTATIQQKEGRITTPTLTLTNATGTPSATVTVIQQGAAYRIIFPQITGASTTATDPSFSGLPANLIPSASRAFINRAFDNSAEVYATMVVAASTGTITLSKPSSSFASSGNKGVLVSSTPWIDL